MIPFLHTLRLVLWAMLFDENRFRRWARAGVGALAISGTVYADQLEPIAHWLAVAVRVLSVIAAIGVAMHGDQVIGAAEPAP